MNNESEKLEMLLMGLQYLAGFEASDIESDDFECLGEDESGNSGCCTLSITDLAEDAFNQLGALQQERGELAARVERLQTMTFDLASKIESQNARNFDLPQSYRDIARAAFELIRESPPVSLKRHDAALLEKWAGYFHDGPIRVSYATETLHSEAIRLSQEAEGHKVIRGTKSERTMLKSRAVYKVTPGDREGGDEQ